MFVQSNFFQKFSSKFQEKKNIFLRIKIFVGILVLGGIIFIGILWIYYRYLFPFIHQLSIPVPTETELNSKKVHIAYFKLIDGKVHVIYDGKDIAEEADPLFGYPYHNLILEKNHIFFTKKINGKNYAFWDNQNLGEIDYHPYLPPKLSGDHIGFARKIEGKWHFIYDGKDMGEIPLFHSSSISSFEIAGDNYAFLSPAGENFNLIYNGKVIRNVIRFWMNEKHLAYIRGSDGHLIYDGKDLGKASVFKKLQGDGILYIKEGKDNASHVFYNGKDLGKLAPNSLSINAEIFGIALLKDGAVYWKKFSDGKVHLIYKGQDCGSVPFIWSFAPLILPPRPFKIFPIRMLETPDDHVLYVYGGYFFYMYGGDLFYDGRYIGRLYPHPSNLRVFTSHNHYAFVNDNLEVVYNGKKVGKLPKPCKDCFFPYIQLAGDHIAYENQYFQFDYTDISQLLRDVKNCWIIYDGKKLDKGFFVRLSEE